MKTTIFGKKAMVAAVVSMVLAFGFVSCSSVYEAKDDGYGGTGKAVTVTLKKSGNYKVEFDGKDASGKAAYTKIELLGLTAESWEDEKFSASVVEKNLEYFSYNGDFKVSSSTTWSKKSIEDGDEDGDYVFTGTIEE